MPTNCSIVFEKNPMKVMYSGQTLRGTVRLNIVKRRTVRGVFIRIYGIGRTTWRSSRNNYEDKEIYLDKIIHFVSGKNSTVKIGPGSYAYPFECILPPELPTSIEGRSGYIRYVTRVVLDVPMWRNTTFEEPFTVIKPFNLNEYPKLQEPMVVRKDTSFHPWCFLCCCPSDPVTIIARIPASGYAAGNLIKLEIDVNNKSDQTISKFKVKLIKTKITYRDALCYIVEGRCDPGMGHIEMKEKEKVNIHKRNAQGCKMNEKQLMRLFFRVPATPPTDSSSSGIINVEYSIRVIGVVGCFHINPKVDIPIIIGTYPFRDGAYIDANKNALQNNRHLGEDDSTLGKKRFKPKYPYFA